MTLWPEAEFEAKCTYIVKDHPWDSNSDGGNIVHAQASLPRNLIFKYAPGSKEVSNAGVIAFDIWMDNLV